MTDNTMPEGAVRALEYALRRCPPDKPQMTDAEFREEVNVWWKLWARPALAALRPSVPDEPSARIAELETEIEQMKRTPTIAYCAIHAGVRVGYTRDGRFLIYPDYVDYEAAKDWAEQSSPEARAAALAKETDDAD